MEATATAQVQETVRYPLSYRQKEWCDFGELGAFGPRFTLSDALRISGEVDPAALQRALDDVVVRHEALRTIVRRDPGTEPYQEVLPPAPVPLEIRERTGLGEQDRVRAAEELLNEVELLPLDPTELPALRAVLTKLDEDDWVLALVSHHTVGDTWSMQVIESDLAAYYTARVSGEPPALAEVRSYGEYAVWQLEEAEGAASARNLAYWAEKLDGARIFTLPSDYPVGKRAEPYRAVNFSVDAASMEKAAELALASRTSVFHVVLAVFNILAAGIRETDDPVVLGSSMGRGERSFTGTVGACLNFIAYRTRLDGAVTFREVLVRTRKTCLEASSHEIPIDIIDRELPELMSPLRGSHNCDLIFGFARARFGGSGLAIAEGARAVIVPEQEATDQPGGASWAMGLADSGEMRGKVQFNPGEFDPSTVRGWTRRYQRLLSAFIAAPDADWRETARAALEVSDVEGVSA